jgi:hypothetical protein
MSTQFMDELNKKLSIGVSVAKNVEFLWTPHPLGQISFQVQRCGYTSCPIHRVARKTTKTHFFAQNAGLLLRRDSNHGPLKQQSKLLSTQPSTIYDFMDEHVHA